MDQTLIVVWSEKMILPESETFAVVWALNGRCDCQRRSREETTTTTTTMWG